MLFGESAAAPKKRRSSKPHKTNHHSATDGAPFILPSFFQPQSPPVTLRFQIQITNVISLIKRDVV